MSFAMRAPFVLFALVALSVSPAAADIKEDIEKMAAAYSDAFNKQDADAVASQYTKGGIVITTMGPRSDIKEAHESIFRAGYNNTEIKVTSAAQVGAYTATAEGEYRYSGKSHSGSPLEFAGRWTAVYVRERGSWKIHIWTVLLPKPQ